MLVEVLPPPDVPLDSSVELAVLHKSWTPPDTWMYKASATNAIKAVSKQYSARPWPRSSRSSERQNARTMDNSTLAPGTAGIIISFVSSGTLALKFPRIEADKNMGRCMSSSTTVFGNAVWNLPPLILHPFNENVPPAALLENSRATLMLSGLISNEGDDPEILARRLLSGRYSEVRMLFFLGKDLFRWIGQCAESIARFPELESAGVREQSFADLLIRNPPPDVKEKLTRWGVGDYSSIFSRALGLNTVFLRPPEADLLAEEFLRSYHRYADFLFRCFLESEPYCSLTAVNFHFDLYASGEYSRKLESEWGKHEQ